MAEPSFLVVGDTLTIARRQFTAAVVEPYVRRDGTPSQLVTWRSQCAVCEVPYEVKGGRAAKHLPLNCEQHRGRRTRTKSLRTIPREAIARALVAIDNGRYAQAREILDSALRQKAEQSA
jgi:hypothetical protein